MKPTNPTPVASVLASADLGAAALAGPVAASTGDANPALGAISYPWDRHHHDLDFDLTPPSLSEQPG